MEPAGRHKSLSEFTPHHFAMYYVYVLRSVKDKVCYIGYTHDLDRRILEHHSGSCIATKDRAPFELVYYEAYSSKKDARLRETRLKQFKNSHKELMKRLSHSLEEQSGGGFNSRSDLARSCELAKSRAH